MSQITITYAQMRDAIHTCALLCNAENMGLGRFGIAFSCEPIMWMEDHQEWHNSDGERMNECGLYNMELKQFAGYEDTLTVTEMPSGLTFEGICGDTQIYPGEPTKTLCLAEVQDMLEIFAQLCGHSFAALSRFGIAYCAAKMRRRSDGWISTDSSIRKRWKTLRTMDLESMHEDDLEATQVEVVRHNLVKYEQEDGNILVYRRDIGNQEE